MGDRTSLEVVIYACPATAVGEILEVLDEYGFERFADEQSATIELGRVYLCGEVLVGSSVEVAAALPATAAWKVWEAPAYEYLGRVHMHHPAMGVFVADCGADGTGVFTGEQFIRLLENTNADSARLARLIGHAWESAFDDLAATNPGTVLTRIAARSAALQSSELASPAVHRTAAPSHVDTQPTAPKTETQR